VAVAVERAHHEPLYRFLQITPSPSFGLPSAVLLGAHFATDDLRTSLLSGIVLSQLSADWIARHHTSHQQAICISLSSKRTEIVERPLCQIQFLSLLVYKFLLGVVGS
jgi:hypothetical protein